MRFKGTLVLLIAVVALGSYIYFYEIKGGEKREKAKEAESQFWKIEDKDIQQMELIFGDRIALTGGFENILVEQVGDLWVHGCLSVREMSSARNR